MKTILFVHDFGELGGAEKALLDLIVGLERSRYLPSVLLFEEGPFKRDLEKCGIKVDEILFPPEVLRLSFTANVAHKVSLVRYAALMLKKIWDVACFVKKGRFDFVITNSLKTLTIVHASRFLGRGHSQHLHYLHYILPESKCMAMWWLDRVISQTDCLVCNSEATLNRVAKNNLQCKKVAIIRQGFDRIKPLRASPISKAWVIGTAGRLSPVKNYEFIIDVAKLLKSRRRNVKVFVAGAAYTESDRLYEKALRRYIDEMGMADVVVFKGFIDDIWGFMDSIDIFMLSSHTESFGRVLAEAMWSAKPIIATHVGAIPEIVENGVTGYTVAIGDVQAAAGIMERLLANPDCAKELGLSGRRFAEKNLSYRSYIDSWEELLASS